MKMMRGTELSAVLCVVGVLGCGGGTDDTARVATWYGGIQPLLVEKCSSCHTDGGAGPFALDRYDSAVDHAPLALAAVEDNVMPPWGAHDTDECAPTRPWKDDLRLSNADKQLLREWVAADMPLGDPAKAKPVPSAPSLELSDASVTMPFRAPFTVPDVQNDVFECFVIDPGIAEFGWITGVQVNPDNRKVTHHALVFLDNAAESEALATDGHFPCFSNPNINVSLIAAWAPGALPTRLPENAGILVKPGARIVVQVHYHPADGDQVDRSSISLKLTSIRPEYEALIALLGNFDDYDASKNTGLMPGAGDGGAPEFLIQAGARNHVETMVYRHELPIAAPVFSVAAHMHYVGTDMKIEHTFANIAADDKECLLQTPSWNFNWQRAYTFDVTVDDLPMIRPGDELVMRCTYDNSMNNVFVAAALEEQGLAAPIDVRFGEQTLDEMCLGVFGVLAPPGLLDSL